MKLTGARGPISFGCVKTCRRDCRTAIGGRINSILRTAMEPGTVTIPPGQSSPVTSSSQHMPSATVAGSAVSSDAPQKSQAGQRERFSTEELAIVLSYFDIGVLDSIVEYPRGSRKAPKLLIVSDNGKFLLKRRARGKDDPFKVAFCHAIQLELASKQFPLPHLIGTKRDNNSMLQLRGAVYELFEYIPGQGYSQ